MALIQLTTVIKAPQQLVFNLSRSIDLHQKSMGHTNEKAIGGRQSGLIELGETVTWQARHLGKTRNLTVKITEMRPFEYFKDEMVKGDFKSMIHHHYFEEGAAGFTVMTDKFYFTSPFGLLGKIVNAVFLTNYMRRLLARRNSIIKEYAETDKWKSISQ